MAAEDFSTLYNLAFYDNFSTKYVYFASLLNYSNSISHKNEKYIGPSEKYDKKRMEVLKTVGQATANFYRAAKDPKKNGNSIFTNHIDKFDLCLKFLATAIKEEQDNEMAYFEQKLNEIKSSFSKKEQENTDIQALISFFEKSKNDKGKIDYPYFITLINGLLSGLKNTKSIAEYESKRLISINKAIEGMKEKRAKQLEGLATARQMGPTETQRMIENSLERYDKQINAYYIKNKNLSSKRNRRGKIYERLTGATSAFKNIPKSVAVELSDWINKQLETILQQPDIVATIADKLNKSGLQDGYKETIVDDVKNAILGALLVEAQARLPEIINNKYKNIPKGEIINTLKKDIDITSDYRIEGYYSNWKTGKRLKGFEDMTKNFELYEASAEGFTEMLLRLQKAINNDYPLSEVQDNLYNYMQENHIYEKYEELGNLINKLKKLADQLKPIEDQIKNDLEVLPQNVEKRITDKNGKKVIMKLTVHVTPEGVTVEGLDQIKSLQAFQNIFGENSNMNLSSLKSTITSLTRNTSINLRDTLAASVNQAINEVAEQEKETLKYELNKMIKDGLENVKIKVTGPDLSEVLSAINFEQIDASHIKVNWAGKTKIKNDVITISINNTQINFQTPINTLIKRQTEKIATLIDQNLSRNEIEEQLSVNVISAFQEATARGFARNTGAQSERYSKNARVFLYQYARFMGKQRNVSDVYKKVLDDWEAYSNRLKKQGIDAYQQERIRERIVNSIKDSFYISDTVKTYNQYVDKLGFSGGSIGANLQSQLNNMQDIFKLAGMPISNSDMEWLYFLIINCADTTLHGRKNAPFIEQYLGSMAAFMLFDEGGAEVMILKDLMNKTKTLNVSSPKILHIYNVNGVYVPGSYVLQQVYLNLQTCKVNIDKLSEPNFHGAGVRIVNPMNESMIPNRGQNKQLNDQNKKKAKPLDTDPWGTIAKKAAKSVSLEIFFLAGLLDIVNSINEKMGNIELPK